MYLWHLCSCMIVVCVGGSHLGRRGDTTISSVGFWCVDGGDGHNVADTPMSAYWGGTMWFWIGWAGGGGTITLGSLRACMLSIGRGSGVPVGLSTLRSPYGSCGVASEGWCMFCGRLGKGWKSGGMVRIFWLARMSASFRRESRLLSLTRTRGNTGAGFRSTAVKSLATAIAWSADDPMGMTRAEENQVRVSAMRSALVSHTQTR